MFISFLIIIIKKGFKLREKVKKFTKNFKIENTIFKNKSSIKIN
jgi:hypothetical protein